ncbi:MAG TPA: hypothetical protein VMA77_23905 [Solirubrobacteraceae bacterium]|nr:hypothetical protein [Solirubrobacteraceae bacterium]
MYVLVDLNQSPSALRLEEADNFRALKVVVRGPALGREQLSRALAPVGVIDDSGNAVLRLGELRRLAGPLSDDPSWGEAFDAMVDYARAKGWGSGTDGVQAHCDWPDVT